MRDKITDFQRRGDAKQPTISVPPNLPRFASRLRARAHFFWPEPPILANSIPKSGTHVLSRLLSLYPEVLHSGRHIRLQELTGNDGNADWPRVSKALAPVGNGHFATSHFPADERLRKTLASQGFKVIFIVRDPRDMLLSYLFYVLKREQHSMHEYLVNGYPDNGSRLMSIIRGINSDHVSSRLPSARERLDDYIDWLGWDIAYTCRFEDLIGSRGGGSDKRQIEEIQRIGSFINRPVSHVTAARIGGLVWSKDSITFRKGVIGDWRDHFSEEHRSAVKELAGDYLVRLGYESDYDW